MIESYKNKLRYFFIQYETLITNTKNKLKKMKILVLILSTIFCINSMYAQTFKTDSIFQSFAAEKDESKRLKMINIFFGQTMNKDPKIDMMYAQQLLKFSLNKKDKIGEASALSQIGWDYISFGNTIKGLEYKLKSIKAAEESGNLEMLADSKLHLGLYYYEQKEFEKVIPLGKSGEEIAIKAKSDIMQTWATWLLGESYRELNKLDTALMYAQRSYDKCMRIKYFDYIDWSYESLGKIQGKLGNHSLALSYFQLAINDAIKKKALGQLNKYYTSYALYLNEKEQQDSAMIYAKKAIDVIQNTPFSIQALIPAKLLLDLYRNKDIASAFKYSEMYRIANDSLFSASKTKQANLMIFTEDLRQEELLAEKYKLQEERKQNIQLALVAFGIVIFLLVFLLLSRSIITNEKVITFLSVVALLLVFEFLNLLLHPFLERITHHSPLLMLLALVIIASGLVPLHHKLEKWTKKQLVVKNKAIRLANAKRTIETLGEEGLG